MALHTGRPGGAGQSEGDRAEGDLGAEPVKRRVMLVDDERHITDICERRLTSLGYEVATASDFGPAIAVAKRFLPHAVVADVEMPGGTGIDLADAMSADASLASVPVILLTGRGHLVEAEAAERANIRGLMPKPFSAKELASRVESLLGVGERAA